MYLFKGQIGEQVSSLHEFVYVFAVDVMRYAVLTYLCGLVYAYKSLMI